ASMGLRLERHQIPNGPKRDALERLELRHMLRCPVFPEWFIHWVFKIGYRIPSYIMELLRGVRAVLEDECVWITVVAIPWAIAVRACQCSLLRGRLFPVFIDRGRSNRGVSAGRTYLRWLLLDGDIPCCHPTFVAILCLNVIEVICGLRIYYLNLVARLERKHSLRTHRRTASKIYASLYFRSLVLGKAPDCGAE